MPWREREKAWLVGFGSPLFALRLHSGIFGPKKEVIVSKKCASRASDEVAEWLRRWTANPLCSARVGSNPILVAVVFLINV